MFNRFPLVAGLVISAIAVSVSPSLSQTLEQSILGTWENKLDPKAPMFVFAPENKLFIVYRNEELEPYFFVGLEYKINSKTQPPQID